MMTSASLKEAATFNAENLLISFGIKKMNDPIGVILGTGWGDQLPLTKTIPLQKLSPFSDLPNLASHKREYGYCQISGKDVVVLNGRIHLNESPGNCQIFEMVRLQTQILMELGVKKLIVTSASGALPNKGIEVDDIVLINKFLTLFSLQMPLNAGEFVSPEDTLSKKLIDIAYADGLYYEIGKVKKGAYAMVLGPNFEGRKLDKHILANLGANIAGMSTLPEACVAALYHAEILAMSFVTNDAVEEHSHKKNTEEVKKNSEKLTTYLTKVITDI